MDEYDPEIAPDPAVWLEMGEGDRLDLVTEYHEQAVHAIGSVLADSIFTRLRGDAPAAEPDYEMGLRTLTVAVWHERYGEEPD